MSRGLAVRVVLLGVVATCLAACGDSKPTQISEQPGGAQGCADIPLGEVVSDQLSRGASVITAIGKLDGNTQDRELTYYGMVLTSVNTLAGPVVKDQSISWINPQVGPSGPIPGGSTGALWATDGKLFGFYMPDSSNLGDTGSTLRIAPVVDGNVIFSSAGCWSTSGLNGHPFAGALSEVPGSDTYARTVRQGGFTAVSLRSVEAIVGQS